MSPGELPSKPPRSWSIGVSGRGEDEEDFCRAAGLDRGRDLAGAEALVPYTDGIRSRGDPLQSHLAIGASHPEEGMVHDGHPALHPRVHVAADADRHLGLVDPHHALRALAGERDVPARGACGLPVDVVQQGIAVPELDGLADLHAEDPRYVNTSDLIHHRRLGRHGEDAFAQPRLEPYEGVLHLAVMHQRVAREHGARVRRRARRDARHV